MKILIPVLLLFVASLPLSAVADTSAEEVTQPPLVAGAKDPMVVLAAVRADLSTLKAEFTQYELTQSNKKVDINSGTVWMATPSQFRWQYVDPIEQLIVADGSQVWVYDEDLEQVTVKQQNNNLNPIYVIINDELSQQHYDIRYVTTDKQIDWISLTPREESEDVKYVWLAVENNAISTIKVFNTYDQIMVFEFAQIEKNPDLDQQLFQFTPPEGVDVIQAIGE
ncbi:outer membrane lipoprotein chaperone LolA [Marinicella litoralis]|nr:outer membrane lipoprotein chaperone LolA [Marinicella litoralis]